MCGVAGIFAYGPDAPRVDREELLRTREAMVPRGPDGAGLWLSDDGRVGLAHRRLAIIDPSDAGAQPMATPEGDLRIVFNGEIYNHQALRTRLEAQGHRFRSTSDTEVLLHLYRHDGPRMVEVLRGMYAFAIWDRVNGGLFLARDPLGIKPLYVADDGRTVRVASQVKALLRGGAVDTAPEPAGHVGFLLWGYVPDPFTLYGGVRALPAGTTAWVDEKGCRAPIPFFNVSHALMPPPGETPPVPPLPPEDCRERLREALADSVRHHLVADVPVGVFLSAGIDSTTLTALASEAADSELRTVTLGFDEFAGTADDEVPLAEAAARRFGTHHSTQRVSFEAFETERDRMLAAMDQPSIDGVNTYFVSRAAAASGLKVALSGLGGDELFGGYPSFRHIPPLVRAVGPLHLPGWVGNGFRRVSAPALRRLTSPKYAGLLSYGGTFGGAYLLRRGLYMPWELPGLMDADMARAGWERLEPLARLEETVAGVAPDRLKVAAMEMTWYMRGQLLRDADWAGMAHGLEIRVPLVDATLLRAVAPLLHGPAPPTKAELAGAPARPLPREAATRAKTGFSVPLSRWLGTGAGAAPDGRSLRRWALRVREGARAA